MLIDKLKEIISFGATDEEAAKLMQEEIAKDNVLKALEDTELGVSLESLGLTEADIDNNDYMHSVDDNEVENFAKKKTTNLYRYVAHTSSGYGSGDLGSNSRAFCKVIVRRTKLSLMRYVDILKLNGSNRGFGLNGANVYSVFLWRGGNNCKHIWVKYVYDNESKSLVKAPRSEQPKQIGKGSVPNA